MSKIAHVNCQLSVQEMDLSIIENPSFIKPWFGILGMSERFPVVKQHHFIVLQGIFLATSF